MKKMQYILAIFATSFVLVVSVSAATSPAPTNSSSKNASANNDPVDITIMTPQEGNVMTNRNAEFRGTAYKNALVNITITDIDTGSVFIEHQDSGRVTGTATSDDNGNWSFVPQQQLIPGKFNISAAIADSSRPSNTINFYVTDENGASSWMATWLKYAIIGCIIALVLIGIVIAIRHWRQRDGDQPYNEEETRYEERPVYEAPVREEYIVRREVPDGMNVDQLAELDQDAALVEKDLSAAARQISRASQEVTEFRDKIHAVEGQVEELVSPEPPQHIRKVTRKVIRRR